jgi:hypothetical protein
MPDDWGLVQLFPGNGLDRSLHAPVFIGLIFLSVFKETLGWTYAGLVVPGYLATVFLAAPATGILVVVESVVSYGLSAALGRILPHTGAWFTFFGRERFLLIIAVSSFVRLLLEGAVVPRLVSELGLSHSRELYSLGLVLVPLLTNSYWNAGLVRALPRMGIVTGLTYVVIDQLLLAHTNFTISRFQVANESVSLAFLESPHAHIILLIGAVLGARNNVRYGWDYNGILVPALLAVAWYQPTKVLATVIEALVVYALSVGLLRIPPFSRLLVVGSRRLVVTFAVGFTVKYLTGTLLLHTAPQVQMVDVFGFGYLLPSLLAVKFWDKQKILRVLMPTLQVSMMAFVLGLGVAYGLRLVSPAPVELAAIERRAQLVDSLAVELMEGDSAPAPHRTGVSRKQSGVYDIGLQLAEAVRADTLVESLELAARVHLSVGATTASDWVAITPAAADPNQDAYGPRFAVRTKRAYGDHWVVVVDRPEPASPTVAVAVDLAERIGAGAIVLRSRLEQIQPSDDAFLTQLTEVLELRAALVVELDPEAALGTAQLSVIGRVPEDLNPAAIERRLGVAVTTEYRAPITGEVLLEAAPRLTLATDVAERAASRQLGSEPLEHWQVHTRRDLEARLRALVGTSPGAFTPPSFRQIRLYGALIDRRLGASTRPPSEWERTLARDLGLRFATLPKGPFQGWALYEPEGLTRHGAATWLQREQQQAPNEPLLVMVPAPRWERGVLAAGEAIALATQADALLIHGTLAPEVEDGRSDARRLEGRHSYFQRGYETWVNRGGRAVSIRGMANAESVSTPVVAAFDSELLGLTDAPLWAQRELALLARLGLEVAVYDGSKERAAFSAAADPAVAFGRRFAPDSTFVLWLREDLRQTFASMRSPRNHRLRFERAGLRPIEQDLPAFLDQRRACAATSESDPSCEKLRPKTGCEVGEVLSRVQQYQTTGNPYLVADWTERGRRCGLAVVAPPEGDVLWLAVANPPGTASTAEWLFPLTRKLWETQPLEVTPAELAGLEHLPLRPLIVRSD